MRLDPTRCLTALVTAAAMGVLAGPLDSTRAQAPGPSPPSTTAAPVSYSSATRNPEFAPVEIADTLMYHKRYQEAIAKYQSIDPKTAEVWNKMGLAYQLMLNLNDAARCYKESIRLNPKSPTVYNNLGTIYESQLEHGKAVKMYRKAIELDPNFALGYKNLAASLMGQHKYKQGRVADARALDLDPKISDPGNYPTVDNPASARDRGAMNYYMAIDCAHAGQTGCALEHLRMALNQGYINANKVAADSNFASLADNPLFQQLLAEQRANRK